VTRKGSSQPRPDGLLLYEAHRRSVAYRLAIVNALTELRPHTCTGCQRAQVILVDVDTLETPPVRLAPVPEPRQAPDGRDTMDAMDVAIAFDVDVRTVTRWITAGKIPSFLDAQGRRRFDTAVIDRLLD